MRIGIVTFTFWTNYGCLLQAYALQTALTRMGHEVEHLQLPVEFTTLHPNWKMPMVYCKRAARKFFCGEHNIPIFMHPHKWIRINTDAFIAYHIHPRYLNEEGILTRSQYQTQVLKLKPLNKKPAAKWSASAVSEVVSDYEYCGHIVNLVRKKEPPIIIKNKRLSIVTEEEYELANKKRLEHKNELESRKNKLDFIYDINGKKLIYSKDEYGFYYSSKVFQLREKTLIKMLYTDAILVLEKMKKDTNKFYQILVKRITVKECKIPKQELEKNLKVLDAEYAKLLEKFFLQKVTSKYFEKMSKELNDKMNAIKDLLNASTNIKTQVTLLERKFNMFLELIKEEPRNEIELIRMMIERVEINKTTDNQYDVKIKYKFEL